jgi:molybdenum cofactor cytidylyltransferase
MTVSKIGGILLAAGGSTRLGEPKQLLVYEGRTLIRRAAETLAASVCSPIVVVTGDDEIPAAELTGLDVHICRNKDWRSGMGSSLKAGLAQLLEIAPAIDAAVVTLCDMPFVTASHLDSLCSSYHESESLIVCAEYGGTLGVPALFGRATFSELSDISNEKGARDLIRSGTFSVTPVHIPEAAQDVDTRDDVRRLQT